MGGGSGDLCLGMEPGGMKGGIGGRWIIWGSGRGWFG